MGSSLAPATDNSLIAGASCASSLLAGAVVVTTRLAQKCCPSDAAKLAQVVKRLVPLRVSGVRPAGANCLHATVAHLGWKRRVLRLGQGSRDMRLGLRAEQMLAEIPTMHCGTSMAGADCRSAIRPCCGKTLSAALRTSPRLAAVGFREIRPTFAPAIASMDDALRASSGLTQPASNTVQSLVVSHILATTCCVQNMGHLATRCDTLPSAQVP